MGVPLVERPFRSTALTPRSSAIVGRANGGFSHDDRQHVPRDVVLQLSWNALSRCVAGKKSFQRSLGRLAKKFPRRLLLESIQAGCYGFGVEK